MTYERLLSNPRLGGLSPVEEHELADALSALSERSRRILGLREAPKMTYKLIGETFNLSHERVRQIYLVSINRIADRIRRGRCGTHSWEPLSMGRRYCPRCRVLERRPSKAQR